MKGTLHLIPVSLADVNADIWLPRHVQEVAGKLQHYIAENAKTARAFLKQMPLSQPIQNISIESLHQQTADAQITQWLAPLLRGQDIGLVSEAGCPAVADPGARVVMLAHTMGVAVKPWVGPSSILLGLMASGLQGQRFAFHGYVPVKPDARKQALRQLEQTSLKEDQTQILIETPYRNQAMLETLKSVLRPQTRLCVASALTSPDEWIRTDTVANWPKVACPDLSRSPTLFLFQA